MVRLKKIKFKKSFKTLTETTRAEYDHLVGEQKTVIHQLRHECETLLAEMKNRKPTIGKNIEFNFLNS